MDKIVQKLLHTVKCEKKFHWKDLLLRLCHDDPAQTCLIRVLLEFLLLSKDGAVLKFEISWLKNLESIFKSILVCRSTAFFRITYKSKSIINYQNCFLFFSRTIPWAATHTRAFNYLHLMNLVKCCRHLNFNLDTGYYVGCLPRCNDGILNNILCLLNNSTLAKVDAVISKFWLPLVFQVSKVNWVFWTVFGAN